MESKYENIDDEQLKYLLVYNHIKNNDKLKSLAEDLEKITMNTNSDNQTDFTGIKLKALNKEIEITSKRMLNTFLTSTALSSETIKNQRKLIKIYMDGVFDVIHSGHFNAIRQSKKLGDILIVGVNSDEDVEKSKGPTLMNTKERAALVRACKWVDEVIEDTPYTPDVKLLDEVGADYCAHGDDMPVNNLGVGCYDEIISAGRLKVFKRTEGISTTEIIGRLLSCAKSSHLESSLSPIKSADYLKKVASEEENFAKAPIMSNFLPTSWRVAEFCNNRVPKNNDKIVYIDGMFDILHIGHIEILRKAKESGDFLYVGLHDDATVNKHRGKNYPILNLQERTFNLLALKYVDEVIIGAPWSVTEDLIKSLKIDLVVQGTAKKTDDFTADNAEDNYTIPKKLGIYKEIESPYDLNNEILVQRLINKRDAYVKKYINKAGKEQEYYNTKGYMGEI
jgi:ethanolamine-phosphate cytidylyltransferase